MRSIIHHGIRPDHLETRICFRFTTNYPLNENKQIRSRQWPTGSNSPFLRSPSDVTWQRGLLGIGSEWKSKARTRSQDQSWVGVGRVGVLGWGQAQAGTGGQSRSRQAGSQVAIVRNRMGLGGQVTSRGGREYLGAPPSPGLGTPVLPAHLLPEERLSIYQKARKKRHISWGARQGH